MATVTTPNQNLPADVEIVYPAAGQVVVGQQLTNRHIESLLNLSPAQLADATLFISLTIDASYDATNPPDVNSWRLLVSRTWQGGQSDRDGSRVLPKLSIDTTNALPEWVRQRVTSTKSINNVSLTVTVN
jgi:hypothetical protein